MKKKLKNKAFLVLTVFALMMAMMPMSALAATTEVSTWGELQAALNSGGDVKLASNVVAESGDTYLKLPAGKTVTLDLNGFSIDRNCLASAASNEGRALDIYGTLTLNDTSNPSTGKITGGNCNQEGRFIGSGVTVRDGGRFTFNSGSICYNRQEDKKRVYGPGVSVTGGGSFIMNGGSIDHNSAGWLGGGVATSPDAAEVKLLGGRITDNSCYLNYGGGLYIYGSQVVLGGALVIKDNIARNYDSKTDISTGETANNLQLSGVNSVSLSAETPLTTGAEIHAHIPDGAGSGYKFVKSTGAAAYESYFTSDTTDNSIAVKWNDADSIYFAQLPVLTAGSVSRTDDTNATVKFTSSIAGGVLLCRCAKRRKCTCH